MAKITAGKSAPSIHLSGYDGKQYTLADALKRGPVVAAFFKISCPVCQFTFPFLERLYEAYGKDGITFWGISQDDAGDTREFCEEYGVKFPALVDADAYDVSNAYGLTNVPSVFLIHPDGKVAVSSVGFIKTDLEKISADLARHSGHKPLPLFRPGEVVPESKPG